jgi:hypothetical protein
MVILTAAGFLAGHHFYPERDVDTGAPSRLTVEVPAYVDESSKGGSLVGMTWFETHWDKPHAGKTMPYDVSVDVIVSFKKGDAANWDSIRRKASRIEISVDLPDGAEVTECRGNPGFLPYSREETECETKNRSMDPNQASAATRRYLLVKASVGDLAIGGKGPDDSAAAGFTFGVKGLRALTLSANRTRAVVEVPSLKPREHLEALRNPVSRPFNVVLSEFGTDDLGKYNWSLRPVMISGPLALWRQRADDDNGAPIAGAREDLIREDSQNEFLAGIAFGAAGGALIGFFQSLFSGWRERRKEIPRTLAVPQQHVNPPMALHHWGPQPDFVPVSPESNSTTQDARNAAGPHG